MTRIAHFRVAVCLGFKASPVAQPGLVEMGGVFSCKSNLLSLEWFSTKTRFEPEANSNSEMASFISGHIVLDKGLAVES